MTLLVACPPTHEVVIAEASILRDTCRYFCAALSDRWSAAHDAVATRFTLPIAHYDGPAEELQHFFTHWVAAYAAGAQEAAWACEMPRRQQQFDMARWFRWHHLASALCFDAFVADIEHLLGAVWPDWLMTQRSFDMADAYVRALLTACAAHPDVCNALFLTVVAWASTVLASMDGYAVYERRAQLRHFLEHNLQVDTCALTILDKDTMVGVMCRACACTVAVGTVGVCTVGHGWELMHHFKGARPCAVMRSGRVDTIHDEPVVVDVGSLDPMAGFCLDTVRIGARYKHVSLEAHDAAADTRQRDHAPLYSGRCTKCHAFAPVLIHWLRPRQRAA